MQRDASELKVDGTRATLFSKGVSPLIESQRRAAMSRPLIINHRVAQKCVSRWKSGIFDPLQLKGHHATKQIGNGVYISVMPNTALFAVAGLHQCYKSACDIMDLPYKRDLSRLLFVEPGITFKFRDCDMLTAQKVEPVDILFLRMSGETHTASIEDSLSGALVFVKRAPLQT